MVVSRSKAPIRPATMFDVAAEAYVSQSTVSQVLRGTGRIHEDTAKRVREAVNELGYVYDPLAAKRRRKSSNVIGVVINDMSNPFFAEVMIGLEPPLTDAGHIMLMTHTGEDLARQEMALLMLREQHAAGIVLCPALGTPASLTATVKSWGIPMVVMVRSLGAGSYDFAGSDHAQGVQLATEHLIAQGHRRIGFLGGQPSPMLEERLRGYQAALDHAHIAFNETLIFTANPTRDGGHEAMKALLTVHPPVKAAVCYNDLAACGALSALKERELHAGTDFALMGYDNVLPVAHTILPLSTVDVCPRELGEHTASILLARIDDPNCTARRFLTSPRLVLRRSG